MIKFFRKIRQKLLSEGKTGKYFKYAIGEIALVVIGILIALQINNWNETRKENNLKQNYYRQILEDLKVDKIDAEYMIRKIDSSLTIFNNYNNTFKEPDLTFDQTFQNVSNIDLLSLLFQFKSTTTKQLVSSGEIKLLDSEIRKIIISYDGKKERLESVYDKNQNSSSNIIEDVALDGGAIIPMLQNQTPLSKVLNIEQRYPEIFLKLDAYHRWKNENEKKLLKSLKELITEIDTITEIINNKLKK